jgi:hypothetical protein
MDFKAVYEWLAVIADMVEDRAEAYELFINNSDEASEFNNRYMGTYGNRPYDDDYTAREYAESSFWEQHTEQDIPASVRNYIDFSSMANDLVLGGDIWVSKGHVFLNS